MTEKKWRMQIEGKNISNSKIEKLKQGSCWQNET